MTWYFWLHPLRGLAALGVVFLHCYWTWPLHDAPLVRHLYLFVDFFFVLSGFVISAGYAYRLRNGHDLRYFFSQRLHRLSFHFLASGALWTLALFVTMDAAQRAGLSGQMLRYVTYVDVFIQQAPSRINPVAWSVMAEFWVYGLFALTALLLPSVRARTVLSVAVAMIGTGVLAQAWPDLNLLYGPGALTRALTGFFLGSFCWTALYGDVVPQRRLCHGVLALLAAGVGVLVATGRSIDLLTIPLSAIVVVSFAGRQAPASPFAVRWLRWLGDLSYPLYLWHFLLSVIMAKVLARLWAVGDGVVILHGERFVTVPPLVGLAASLVLVLLSVAWSALMMQAEKAWWAAWSRRKRK